MALSPQYVRAPCHMIDVNVESCVVLADRSMKSSNFKTMSAQELKYRTIMGHACVIYPHHSVVRYVCANV